MLGVVNVVCAVHDVVRIGHFGCSHGVDWGLLVVCLATPTFVKVWVKSLGKVWCVHRMDRREIDGFWGGEMGKPKLLFRGRGVIRAYVSRHIFGLGAFVEVCHVSFGSLSGFRELGFVVPVEDESIPIGTVVDVNLEIMQGASMVVSATTLVVVKEDPPGLLTGRLLGAGGVAGFLPG